MTTPLTFLVASQRAEVSDALTQLQKLAVRLRDDKGAVRIIVDCSVAVSRIERLCTVIETQHASAEPASSERDTQPAPAMTEGEETRP